MHGIEIRKRGEYIPIQSKIPHDLILTYPIVSEILSYAMSKIGES